MPGRVWISPVVAIGLALGGAGAVAQGAGPDEADNPHGAAGQKLSLTAPQKSAIYHAVMRQQVRASTAFILTAAATPAPQSIQLSELPDRTGIDDAMFLIYAAVKDDVVVVDPIRMRVVDIMHGSTRP